MEQKKYVFMVMEEASHKINKKEMTGYASIDQPWLMFYENQAIYAKMPAMTAYDYMRLNNGLYLQRTAIDYFGNTITYKELFRQIDRIANSFLALGVKPNDVVAICASGLPEVIYCFYALNKIGAISCMIDPRTNTARITDHLNDVHANLVVIIDAYYEKIHTAVKETDISKEIIVSPSTSLKMVTKNVYKQKTKHVVPRIKSSKFTISWEAFYDLGKKSKQEVWYPYRANSVAAIILTSGTTGVPKMAPLSNYNLNSIVEKYRYVKMPITAGQKILNIMPPFIAYGLTFGIHMATSRGITNIIIPKFEVEKFASLILKHKPDHLLGVPSHFEYLMYDKKMQQADLSFLKTISAGGDRMLVDVQRKINQFLTERGFHKGINVGYGMTEMCSSAITQMEGLNEPGTVGIPLVGNIAAIFDEETEEELPYGEEGELCLRGDGAIYDGYLNNPQETAKLLKKHRDGYVWVHTGDIAVINEFGIVKIVGRKKVVIIRPDGHNVFPSQIENVLMKNKDVQTCAVVGIKAKESAHGEYPKAYIVLDKTCRLTEKEMEKKLRRLCSQSLPERDVAYQYEFVKELPLTSGGKVDYLKLKAKEEMKKKEKVKS